MSSRNIWMWHSKRDTRRNIQSETQVSWSLPYPDPDINTWNTTACSAPWQWKARTIIQLLRNWLVVYSQENHHGRWFFILIRYDDELGNNISGSYSMLFNFQKGNKKPKPYPLLYRMKAAARIMLAHHPGLQKPWTQPLQPCKFHAAATARIQLYWTS